MSTVPPEVTTPSIPPPINVPDTRLIGEESYSKKMKNILRILKMKADRQVPLEYTPIRVTLIDFLEGMKEFIQPDGDVPLIEGNFRMPTEYNNRMVVLLGNILDMLEHEFANHLKNAEIQLHPDRDIQGAYYITLEVTPRIVLDAYNPVLFLVQLRNYILEVLDGSNILGGKRKVVKRKRKSLKKNSKSKRRKSMKKKQRKSKKKGRR
jgi:hypothetical protein